MKTQISTVAAWYRGGLFKSEEQAQGAFELSYQQALDGAGDSIPAHMGLSTDEFARFMRGASPQEVCRRGDA